MTDLTPPAIRGHAARSLRSLPRWAGILGSSALCTASLRARGVQCTFVTCEGRLPRIHATGRVHLGRIALRGHLLRVELGAVAGGLLTIGSRTFINQGSSLVAAQQIDIGNNVRIGDLVAIYDTDYHPVDQVTPTKVAPVRIGDNVWLGRGAIVLPGSVIGTHAVVAAGSVVSGNVPARTLVAGSPAQPLKELVAEAGWRRP